MENNFGLILLDLVRKNKDKFLGLLRRNGVLVNSNTSCEDLTNMILKAMQKSESFKKETILLMGVLMGNGDSSFANFTDGFKPLDLSSGVGYQSTYFPAQNSTTPSVTTDKTKKEFADTTVGKITDQLFGAFDKFLQNKDLDVRKAEAQAGQAIAVSNNTSSNVPAPKSNTGLYVALGVGGLALVGVLVYVISKKK